MGVQLGAFHMPAQPVHLYMEVTNACNLRCTHCYLEAGEGNSRNLASETIHEILTEFAEMGGQFVSFSGGEPLLHPGWRPAVRYARYLGLDTVLLTNGTQITDDDLDFLQEVDSYLGISVDGASAQIHDAIRGEGEFDALMQTLERLTLRGGHGRAMFCFTPMAVNYRELPGIVGLARSNGIGAVYLSLLERRGRAARKIDDLALDESAATALLYSVLSLKQRYPEVHLDCPNLRFFPERLLGAEVDSGNLDHTLRVTCDGDLYLTAYLDDETFNLGRFRSGELHRAWFGDTCQGAFAEANDAVAESPLCRGCRAWSWCRGGSAALAWIRNRSFRGVDSFCTVKQRLVDEYAGYLS